MNPLMSYLTRRYPIPKRAWIEINPQNLRHNINSLKKILPKQCEIMAVVKADAYGHGMKIISKESVKSGIRSFAVATVTEAIALRKNGIKGNILILGITEPCDFSRLAKYKLTQTVTDKNYGEVLEKFGKKMKVHIKIDTGMHRLGEKYDNIEPILQLFKYKNLIVEGMYTHLSCADSLDASDEAFSRMQIGRFYDTINNLHKYGCYTGKLHVQSSYGVLNYQELSCDYARVGLALYGVPSSPGECTTLAAELRPVLSLKSKIVQIKQIERGESVGYSRCFNAVEAMKIGIVSIGYADGLPRNYYENGGCVLVHGERVPIVGKICMDMMMVDVTKISGVKRGDTVTIIGEDGAEVIKCEEVAQKCKTISNELLSRLGSRLERIIC